MVSFFVFGEVGMYLKALEIQGFKSFPDKVRLTFDEPITAIVGPNGSGKSNISDALCWVMGEQSNRALRSGKMEDVIFGGTQKRPQMGYAQASLILDNRSGSFPLDASEVMVTRRYYRSGESEYYINKQTVRLKDINELFMDTGLGRDGYSIIGQGKIDDILSKRSVERREIFEEAAGISKYRYRKEEAGRKLAAAHDNLVRISDKITELEMQVEPLRRQAEEARRYLVCRDELRTLEAALWTEALEKIQQNEAQNRLNFEQAAQALTRTKEELDALYAESEALSRRMGEEEVALLTLREGISLREVGIAETESSLRMSESLARANDESKRRILDDIDREEKKAQSAAEIVSARWGRIEKIDEETSGLQARLAALESSSGDTLRAAGAALAEMEALRKKRAQCLADAAAKEAELTAFQERQEESGVRGARVMARVKEAAARLEKAQGDASDNAEDLADAEKETAEWVRKTESCAQAVKETAAAAQAAADKAAKSQVVKNSLESRAAMLREMEKEYEGFGKAVKTVMQAAESGKLKNIHGPVSRLIRVDEHYTVAIETALGAAMQNIVTSRREDAKSAMELLRDTDSGRATFLPMDAVKPYGNNDNYSGEKGFIAMASELVRFDESYADIVESLLGRTLVVEDLDKAVALGKKYNSRLRIVTVDGQMMNPGGSMTGGSVSRKSGALSRANELEKVEKELILLTARAEAAVKTEKAARSQREEAAVALEDARLRQRFVADEVASLRSRAQHLAENIEALGADLKSAHDEAELWRAESSGAQSRQQALQEAIQALVIQSDELEQQINEKSAGREKLESASAAIYDDISAARSAIAGLKAERDSCLGAISDFENAAREYEETGRRQSAEFESCAAREAELAAAMAESSLRLESEKAAVGALRERLKSGVAEKLDMEARRTSTEKQTQEKNREIIDLEREYARLEQKQSGGLMEEKHILDRMWETYGLTRSAAKAAAAQLDGTTGAKARAAKLKNEMSTMGHPNLGAIEEFDRVNERYQFLSTQRADAEEARVKLEQIISNLTASMREQFIEKFAEINRSFQETFFEIFGGGSASVSLEDSSDVLGCGIEIKVQPPGKQVKSISLLSGGEKAFIAIALYFAILKVRPTPFCVMDEIETALDEVNTVRCAKYLRKMSESTQLVVITHRRPTIEEADVLYGVAMQEQGVSKVLSLRLGEMERELGIS